MKTFLLILFIVIILIFFGAGIIGALKGIFTTKEAVGVIKGKVIYKEVGNHWLYNLSCFLMGLFIFGGILEIISYYLK